MKTLNQWRLTLRWSTRITIGFFIFYALVVLLRLPGAYGEIQNVFPDDMKENFVAMAIMSPFIFGFLFFITCFVVLRLILFISGTLIAFRPTQLEQE